MTRTVRAPAPARTGHGSHRADEERKGSRTSSICLPVFFLLVIVGIQFALWSHAAHLARAAAEQGSQVASGYGSSQMRAPRPPTSSSHTTGPGTLTGAQVSTTTLLW